jgi:2-polyprenyl-3-methyl-5-hydroxy-6-metoxy-1,4-benzoquinol methylase
MAQVHDRERPTFEKENNVTVQRCFFAYQFARPFIEGKTVADVGCGNGYGSEYLAQFATHVTGLDYSEVTVADNTQRLAHIPNLQFKACKVPPLALADASVDVVTAFQFIEHIHPRHDFMVDVLRVLKPGGVFICTTPNIKKSIARNPFHVHEYTFDEMKTEAGSVFADFELKGLDGNTRVNEYYAKNQAWAKKILRLDPWVFIN